jgi:hypothetical protein
MAQNKAGFDPTQTAKYWLEKKVYTVPLRSRSKRPKTTNWPHLRLVEDDLNNGAFKPGDNIGALWGDASDHATDVDLDMEEAIWVADYILPETFIYGRTGKERSHYVYKVMGAQTRKWQVQELGTIIEIRSTGAQSVIPPSRHPEGGIYCTDEDEDFTQLTKLDLERYAEEIAVAAVFTRHYPSAGSRHDYVHACTGALCHQEWPDEKIGRVMEAVLNVIQDEEDEISDRVNAVRNTVEHHKLGDRTKGFTSLEAWMSMPVIAALRRWTTSGKMEGKLVMAPPNLKPEPSRLTFDESLLKVPGLVGEITTWANRESFIDQPLFGLATGLTCTALATCNHYLVESWDTPLQPYLMVTAPTGGGKDTCHRSVAKFAIKLGLDEAVIQHFQSYYAMLDHLGEEGIGCWLWDEAARYMSSAKKPSSTDFQTLSHVISLYGAANKFVPGAPGRNRAIPPLDHPFLVVLATAQPDMLMDALTSTAQETGFVNRFILFDTGIEYRGVNQRRSHVFPSAISKHAKQLRDHEPMDGDFTDVKFADTRTYSAFQEFEEVSRRRAMGGQATWSRANQNALIMAGIAAVGADAQRPVIDFNLCKWAIQLVSWSNDCWDEKLRMTAATDSYTEKDSFKIERIINNSQKYAEQKANSIPQRMLLQQGFTPHSVITRNTRGIDPKRRTQILDDLHEGGLIGSTEKNDQVVYFPHKPK